MDNIDRKDDIYMGILDELAEELEVSAEKHGIISEENDHFVHCSIFNIGWDNG